MKLAGVSLILFGKPSFKDLSLAEKLYEIANFPKKVLVPSTSPSGIVPGI